MQWKFDGRDKTESPLTASGSLVFKGDNGVVENIPLPMFSSASSARVPLDKTSLVIGDTVLHAEVKPATKPERVELTFWRQPTTIKLSGKGDEGLIWVSQQNAVTIDNTQFRVSAEPKLYPDGSAYYELEMQDRDSGASATMPLAHNAKRILGRFQVLQAEFSEPSRTAAMKVVAELDMKNHGLDTQIDKGLAIERDDDLERFFTRLGKQYGFEIEWMDAEGMEASAIDAKRGRWILEDTSPEWKLPGESKTCSLFDCLAVRVESYASQKPLELQRVNERKLMIRPGKAFIERRMRKAESEREREEITGDFESNYAPDTRIYNVQRNAAVTAKTLIDQELKTYVLLHGQNAPKNSVAIRLNQIKDQGEVAPGGETTLKDNDWKTGIYALPSGTDVERATSVTKEYVVQDENAGVLLVKAIPSTHAKVESILNRVQTLIATATTTAPAVMPHYRMELFLLRGAKAGSNDRASSETLDPAPFGLTREDLQMFGFDRVTLVGSGIVNLAGISSDEGEALVMLSANYSVELEYQDYRRPYAIVRGTLKGIEIPVGPNMFKSANLLESTMYLEPNKPTVLGLTNLKEALILVVRLRD